jgi:hypothetical protein
MTGRFALRRIRTAIEREIVTVGRAYATTGGNRAPAVELGNETPETETAREIPGRETQMTVTETVTGTGIEIVIGMHDARDANEAHRYLAETGTETATATESGTGEEGIVGTEAAAADEAGAEPREFLFQFTHGALLMSIRYPTTPNPPRIR